MGVLCVISLVAMVAWTLVNSSAGGEAGAVAHCRGAPGLGYQFYLVAEPQWPARQAAGPGVPRRYRPPYRGVYPATGREVGHGAQWQDWTITLRKGIKFHDNWGSSPPKTCAIRCS